MIRLMPEAAPVMMATLLPNSASTVAPCLTGHHRHRRRGRTPLPTEDLRRDTSGVMRDCAVIDVDRILARAALRNKSSLVFAGCTGCLENMAVAGLPRQPTPAMVTSACATTDGHFHPRWRAARS